MITLQVQPAQTYQTVRGFGASGAWWSQIIGGWSDENRRRIINLLVNPMIGIGLTIYRYNIGGGEHCLEDRWRNTETFEVSAGEYDWSRDTNARRVLREVCDAGVTEVIVFANSPTERMTVSGRAAGNPGGSNLLPDRHDDFAQYLVDVSRYLIEEEAIPVRWISPINEPQWDWQPAKGQEGTHYTTGEIISVLRALQSAIEQSGLDVKISAIDAGEWNTAGHYVRRILEEPVLARALDHFAVHSYASAAISKVQLADFMQQHYPNVALWMSEWTELQTGRDYSMESALTLANTLHDDLILGNVVTWQYWIAVSKYDYRDGLIYTDESGECIEETKRLWVLGNYSRFVRPGAVRIEADADHEDVRVSAFVDSTTGALTLVVINNSAEPREMMFMGIDPNQRRVSVYETSDVNDLTCVYSDSLPEAFTLSPTSVSTFVFR